MTQLLQRPTEFYYKHESSYMAVLAPLDVIVSLRKTLESLIDAHRMANQYDSTEPMIVHEFLDVISHRQIVVYDVVR